MFEQHDKTEREKDEKREPEKAADQRHGESVADRICGVKLAYFAARFAPNQAKVRIEQAPQAAILLP